MKIHILTRLHPQGKGGPFRDLLCRTSQICVFSHAIQTRNRNDRTGVIISMNDEANVTRIIRYVGEDTLRSSDRLRSRHVRRISCPVRSGTTQNGRVSGPRIGCYLGRYGGFRDLEVSVTHTDRHTDDGRTKNLERLYTIGP